jgi:hypothetical protein
MPVSDERNAGTVGYFIENPPRETPIDVPPVLSRPVEIIEIDGARAQAANSAPGPVQLKNDAATAESIKRFERDLPSGIDSRAEEIEIRERDVATVA